MPESAMTFEETLSVLQGLLGRLVFVFIGGSSGDPGIVAYSTGVLRSAAPDEGFDELLEDAGHSGGEALHFSVVDIRDDPRLVFVVHEDFFLQGLWATPEHRLLWITQRDLSNPESVGLAITLRLED